MRRAHLSKKTSPKRHLPLTLAFNNLQSQVDSCGLRDENFNWSEMELNSIQCTVSRTIESNLSPNLEGVVDHSSISAPSLYSHLDTSELMDHLFDCETIDDLFDCLKSASELFSGSYFLLQVIVERSLCEYRHRLVTDYPKEFVSSYVDRNYYFVDPIVETCRSNSGFFFWDEVSVTSPVSSFYQACARTYGIGPSGATFVSENVVGDICAVTMSSGMNENEFRSKFELRKGAFCNVSKRIIDVFTELSSLAHAQTFNLTNDQIRVLYDIAHGTSESDLEMRKYLFGSYSNVKKSILKICRTKTLAQAAVLAAKRGFLEDIPYALKDILGVASRGNPAILNGNPPILNVVHS